MLKNKYKLFNTFISSNFLLSRKHTFHFFYITSKVLLYCFKKFIRMLILLKDHNFTMQIYNEDMCFILLTKLFEVIKFKKLTHFKFVKHIEYTLNSRSLLIGVNSPKECFIKINRCVNRKIYALTSFQDTMQVLNKSVYQIPFIFSNLQNFLFLFFLLTLPFAYDKK